MCVLNFSLICVLHRWDVINPCESVRRTVIYIREIWVYWKHYLLNKKISDVSSVSGRVWNVGAHSREDWGRVCTPLCKSNGTFCLGSNIGKLIFFSKNKKTVLKSHISTICPVNLVFVNRLMIKIWRRKHAWGQKYSCKIHIVFGNFTCIECALLLYAVPNVWYFN